MMNEFHAEKLAGVLVLLKLLEGSADCIKSFGGPGMPTEPGNLVRLATVLRDAEILFKELGMGKAHQQVVLAKDSLNYYQKQNVSETAVEIRRIIETIMTELSERKFLFVSSDRDKYYENANLFGEAVIRKFPLAKLDIVEAGNCLCAERHTAAVFHLMRAFEWALRTFCDELGLRRMSDWDKKNGKFKYSPASFAQWEKILNQLPGRIEKRLRPLRAGARRQHLQEYYSSALEDIKCVKDAWRNHVMHTRMTFGRDDAQAVFTHVGNIMGRLANDKAKTIRV